MTDISLCSDTKCPSRGICYRYRAYPAIVGQAYFYPGRLPTEDRCEYFLSIVYKNGSLRPTALIDKLYKEDIVV